MGIMVWSTRPHDEEDFNAVPRAHRRLYWKHKTSLSNNIVQNSNTGEFIRMTYGVNMFDMTLVVRDWDTNVRHESVYSYY